MKQFFKVLSHLLLFSIILHFFQCNTLPIRDYADPTNRIYKTIYIDEQFNESQIQTIKNAAKEWENSTHNIINFDIKNFDRNYAKLITNRDDVIVFLECPPDSLHLALIDEAIKKRDKNNITLGFYDNSRIVPTIFIVNTRVKNINLYRKVSLHELGHALGLEHSEDTKNSIMYRSLDEASDGISDNDLNEFCKKYFCNLK